MSVTPDRTECGAFRRRGLSGSLRWVVFLRTLTLQASWNVQRMQNLGLLTIMVPFLRNQTRELNADRVFCRRYYEFFNTNPYLANYVVGGLIRLEEENARLDSEDVVPTATFRDSLGRAFASLGDQLFWMGIRPALTMGICLLAMAGQSGAVVGIVATFACLQLGLRWISLRRGYDLGLDVVDLLSDPRWHHWIRGARTAAALTTGLVAGAYLARLEAPDLKGGDVLPWIGLFLGWVLPALLRRRLPGEGLLGFATILVIVLAFAI